MAGEIQLNSTSFASESGGTITINNATLASAVDLSNHYASTSEVQGTHTTGSITSGTTSLTIASGSGISNGDYVVGEGITPGTIVSSGGGTTSITLSANAAATLSSDPVSFYTANKALSPGLVAGQLCRAWVNFNGTGTVAIRAANNVSSISDNGTGDYTINFATEMPDNDYVVAACGRHYNGVSDHGVYVCIQTSDGDATVGTSSVRISTHQASSSLQDSPLVSLAIFR
jgi:hypothetical protein